MELTREEILAMTDLTYLKSDASVEVIYDLCKRAIDLKPASICIPPYYVKASHTFVDGQVKICTVAGFPNGYQTLKAKSYEAMDALESGADEIDMVINIAALKNTNHKYVRDEIAVIKELCEERILKVIIETVLLTQEEKIEMCKIVSDAGADYIKTSTGFAGGGATLEDVRLFKEHVDPSVKIKAAGGIRTLEQANAFVKEGASRIGSSSVF